MPASLQKHHLCCLVNSCGKIAKNIIFLRNLSLFDEELSQLRRAGVFLRQELRINTKETGFFTKIHRFPDRVKHPVSEPPQALGEKTLQLQTAFNVTEE
jgi:hypothetical protein